MGCCGRFWKDFRKEWSLRNAKLEHPEPHLFLASEWQGEERRGVKLWYVLYRWAWALYHFSWWVASLVSEGGVDSSIARKAYHFIYLTNWSYISIVVMTTTQATIVTLGYLQGRRNPSPPKTMKTRLKVLWVMQNLVYLPALLITAAYWSAIYDPQSPVTALNAEVHIINSVYVLIDLMIVGGPVRVMHFYMPLVFMFLYAAFTLVYWAVGGTTPEGNAAIYPILDWDNLTVTLPFVICCTFFSPLMQGVVWLIFWGRRTSREQCCQRSGSASLPHENTMDVIMARDASTDSVAANAISTANNLQV
ncbi:protein rolling stone-like [Penaeus japonicus]|uniref:protein rolling stone-like n=1 Tax=Penaeus japonicus TaxID=27405 RepID=UPI001C71464B|nr:protein rolling stone-like [Penaeus japonicus]XP_042870208.1 protein rolling stone-like [Penaeus japonicus]